MFKQVCLLTKRPGMSMDEFKDYYENRHAPLLAPMMPKARRYVRRYVQPEVHAFVDAPVEVPFDCLMELWWDSREDFEQAMASLGESDKLGQIYEDEEKIFASHSNPVFSVEDDESEMRGFEHTPALGGLRQCDGREGTMKMLILLKRRPGMSMEDFRDYYEKSHRKLGEKAMPRALRYARRFVQPEHNPITGEAIELPFDVIVEIWCESRADWEDMLANVVESGLGQEIYDDEEKLFASHANPAFTVVESDSPMRGW